jgi:hypothetical protein
MSWGRERDGGLFLSRFGITGGSRETCRRSMLSRC